MDETRKPSTSISSSDLTVEETGPPHESLFLVLAYLPVYELLTVSQVCKSLRDAVNKDILPWLNLILDKPLNSRLTDEILVGIASKAKGRLQTLALINCAKITDHGFLRVIEENLLIDKLFIPECTGISPEGILKAVEILCHGNHCLSSLRINGIYNLRKEHLDMLGIYLKNHLQSEEQKNPKPIYYHQRCNLLSLNREENPWTIDLEICPLCCEVRMVFDCPKGACKQRRGCKFCIPRCENCGECIESDQIEETACADFLCLKCWLQLPKCNFCNKPYCKQHRNWQCSSTESGFVCKACDDKQFLGYLVGDVEW
ncbi:hypothetical protein L6164_001525 [Bauhinia variegata]|uniref:Uncharacterized protein n=1 Tax=Bauhinia variegata TaxID=167791 RepID=A0ACB9QC36_BAUVA|nr:hypothetical protein L6164_001525 [Bauhinia variegata]